MQPRSVISFCCRIVVIQAIITPPSRQVLSDYNYTSYPLGCGDSFRGTIVCTSAAFTFKYFYVDSATGETSVPMQTMVKWAQTEADPDPDDP
ncbi:MAG: hypothetical protein IJQ61_10880 [Bacteroidales bacterium]|nr:hypothetical protein [Bacteroidales bacterium]